MTNLIKNINININNQDIFNKNILNKETTQYYMLPSVYISFVRLIKT